jgi:hypothetical protein
MSSTTTSGPTFKNDVAGDHVVTLFVNDGTASSAPSTVTPTARQYSGNALAWK